MSTGIRQKVTQDQWDNHRHLVISALDDTMGVQFKLTKGRPVTLIVEHWEKKRSDEQNSYLWAMFTQVAGEMTRVSAGKFTYTKDDAHDLLLQKRYGVEKRMIGNTEVVTQKKTSKMEVGEATDFIEWVLSWCADRGWSVMMPKDYASWARAVK